MGKQSQPKKGIDMRTVAVVLLCAVLSIPSFAVAKGGHYAGGHGSSHKGGKYKNPRTGDHYERRR